MTRMTGPDWAVMCDLMNTHTYTHTHHDRLVALTVLRPLRRHASGVVDEHIQRRISVKE